MKKKEQEQDWKSRLGVVYSTNKEYDYDYEELEPEETLAPEEQTLYISLDRKQRKGKTVTLIEGFVGTPEDLKALEKIIKQKMGTGGSCKEGNILIQGDYKEKIGNLLSSKAYAVKYKG